MFIGDYCTVTVAAGLATPPTEITTGCAPGAIAAGIVKLTCMTPAVPLCNPAKATAAFNPPTVTVTGSLGFGKRDAEVPSAGVEPVAVEGVRSPSPVT